MKKDESMADSETVLEGGHLTGEVMRVGDTVHRSSGLHSVFVAALLTDLRQAGFVGAPAYLGRDCQGRDMFEYVPGNTSDRGTRRHRNDDCYTAAGALARGLHDATAGSALAAGEECVVHGDLGPFNTIFRDGQPVAFIDWDFARPGRRSGEIGYMAWMWCLGLGDTPADEARRLAQLHAGYGLLTAEQLLDGMRATQAFEVRYAQQRLRLDTDPSAHAAAADALAWALACQERTDRYAGMFLKALRRGL